MRTQVAGLVAEAAAGCYYFSTSEATSLLLLYWRLPVGRGAKHGRSSPRPKNETEERTTFAVHEEHARPRGLSLSLAAAARVEAASFFPP